MSALAGGSNYDTAKFKSVGDSVSGTIIEFADVQEREFADDPNKGVKKGDLKWWDAAQTQPILQVRVTLETRPGDASSRVNVYVSGKRMKAAVREAFAKAGVDDLTPQSEISITFTGYEGPAKCYKASYVPFDPTA